MFQQIIDFIKNNLTLIVYAVGVVIYLFLVIITTKKTRPNLNWFSDINNFLDKILPDEIIKAESTGANGQVKLLFVLSAISKCLKKQFKVNIDLTDNNSPYYALIVSKIESYLDTPQRHNKEVKND